MKKIPVSIHAQLTIDGSQWKQQLKNYRQLGYRLIELDFELFKHLDPEELSQELQQNQLRISAIQVAEKVAIEEHLRETITQFYRLLIRYPGDLVQDMMVIVQEEIVIEELFVDWQAGYWHNLLKNLQFFTDFMQQVFSMETLIQPGWVGVIAENSFVSQFSQATNRLGLWLDTGYLSYGKKDPLKVLKQGQRYLRYLRLTDVTDVVFKDEPGPFAACRSFVGEGVIDFGVLFDQLLKAPETASKVCVQPLLPSDSTDYWEECADTLRYLEEIGFN